MRATLMVLGMVMLAVALRASRRRMMRRMGAMAYVTASFLLVYFLTDSWLGGLAGAAMWAFMPWVELLTRIRRLRLPLENRLSRRPIPNPAYFPNASEAAMAMEEAGFEHVSDCGWDWAGMRQFFSLFWHPEERAVSAVCLCEQSDVVFAFISITSHDGEGRLWRTTNFPFAPTLRCPPEVRWNHVPCGKNCFHEILRDHRAYLEMKKIPLRELRVPDPERIEESVEEEMRRQIQHNLACGIIKHSGDGHFRYSKRGLLFLWGQYLKDMLRFC
ncbi:MAG: hypothetical protein ACO3F7_01395 [Luteolibacter sp.]